MPPFALQNDSSSSTGEAFVYIVDDAILYVRDVTAYFALTRLTTLTEFSGKLATDTIVEALFEIRFESGENARAPELVIGSLLKWKFWSDFEVTRLPIADLPVEIRNSEPSLKRQPFYELTEKDGPKVVKIGPNVISFHSLNSYPFWEEFRPAALSISEALNDNLSDVQYGRLGLRYINLFNEYDHGISSILDLDFSVLAGGQPMPTPINLTMQSEKSEEHVVQVKLASPEYVKLSSPREISGLLDIDVFTSEKWQANEEYDVPKWIEAAHDYEKKAYFSFVGQDILDRLAKD